VEDKAVKRSPDVGGQGSRAEEDIVVEVHELKGREEENGVETYWC